MKRTAFARKASGPQHIGEILRDRVLPALYRVPASSAAVFRPMPKQEYVRDEGYRRFVASLPCFQCGAVGISQAAHSNQGGAGKGMAIKASDVNLFPLCADQPLRRGCHTLHDQCVDMTNDERLAREQEYLQRMTAFNKRTERS